MNGEFSEFGSCSCDIFGFQISHLCGSSVSSHAGDLLRFDIGVTDAMAIRFGVPLLCDALISDSVYDDYDRQTTAAGEKSGKP